MAERRAPSWWPQLALVSAGFFLFAWVFTRAGTVLVVSLPITTPDVIVSLASHEWERLPVTAALAVKHPDATVVLTTPPHVTEFNCHDCANRVSRLETRGVAPARVHVIPITGSGTYGEAESVQQYLKQSDAHRLLLVTSAYHTRRALATFRTVLRGSDVQVGVAAAPSSSQGTPENWWRTPYDRWYVRYEWMAIVYYALRYGVLGV